MHKKIKITMNEMINIFQEYKIDQLSSGVYQDLYLLKMLLICYYEKVLSKSELSNYIYILGGNIDMKKVKKIKDTNLLLIKKDNNYCFYGIENDILITIWKDCKITDYTKLQIEETFAETIKRTYKVQKQDLRKYSNFLKEKKFIFIGIGTIIGLIISLIVIKNTRKNKM